MDGPRAPTASEFPQILDFLNAELRPSSHWSIAKEYPTALTSSNLSNMRFISNETEIISHAVIKPLIIKTPLMVIKAAAIGSVVTGDKFRGQGYSGKIMNECIEEAQRQKCDIAILWTNLYDFYRKFDFELGGFEESFIIENDFNVEQKGLKFIQGASVAPEAIFRLYNQHTVSTIRTIEDIRKFMTIPNSHLFTAWDTTGQLAAYAVEGKGADLSGYIHEWGGKVSDIMALFSHIRKTKQGPITVISPFHSLNLISTMKKFPFVHNEGYLGMIKITNLASLMQKLKRAAGVLGVNDFVFEFSNGVYKIGIGKDTLEFSEPKAVVRLMFGPFPEITELRPETLNGLQKFLPLPLWIWGWDSI